MENGDGRPLDDETAGGEDPQGWYFDLPGGAWERQEEKNRTLRQRVLGNISEDAEKAKSDPFARRVPDPEPPAKGGLFGFGRKKKQQDPPRESAGGTWTFSGSPMPEKDPNRDDPGEADDWSTEIPLRLDPPQDLTLRRRTEAEHGEPWGAADAGWSIGADDGDAHAASSREDSEDFRHRMQFWARGGGPEPGAEPGDSAGEVDGEFAEDGAPGAVDDPVAAVVEAPYGDDAAVGEAAPVDETAEADEDFISSMGSWAKASPGESAEEDQEEAPAPPRNDVLQLRPRHAEPDEKRLDWGFQPGGWSQAAARDNEPGAGAAESAHFPGEPNEPDEPADMLESMRRWAEHAKESEHPHFALQHQGEDEAAGPVPPVIPLRPRNHEEHPDEHAPADEDAEHAEPDQPRTIPIVLRSRTEPPPEAASRGPEEMPTRWDEFFGLNQPDEGDDGNETADTPNDGLAAMRDWAMKRPEADAEQGIPEEFLKPFDWELGDDDSTDTAGRINAEAAEPSEWEAADETALTAFAVETAADAQDESVAGDAGWIAGAAPADGQTEPVASEPAAITETRESDEDPLAGLFDRPEVPATRGKGRGGLFGRLFGRKKQEPESEPTPASVDHEPGDWILQEEDSDVRTVASESTPEWVAVEDEDQPGASAPYGTFADSPDAGDTEVVAAFSSGENDEFDDEWVEVDEPSPAAMLHEIVTAFERPAVSEAADVPVAESGWDPEEAAEGAPDGEQAAEPAIVSVLSESREDGDEFAWEPEPVAYEEPTASTVGPDHTEVHPDEAPPPAAVIQLSLDALEAADAEVVASDAAAELVEPVAEEPVTDEKPWWEEPTAEEEAPVEAVASVEPVVEEPVADEKPWWEQPAAEEEAPVEAVASVEPVTEEPVADEKPWWEQPAAEEETPVEAVASVEPLAEEPAADEKPWWEQPAAEEEAPVEAVASAEPVVEEPVADEKPWWEQPAAEEEAPVEAVASVEPVTEEPVADEKPWWEQPAAEEEAPVEAVASVEPVTEMPVADEKPWWERPAAEEEAPVEAVASVEPVTEMPVADEKPWWEQPAIEDETPAEAVASVEPVVEEPVTDEQSSWEQPAAEEEAPVVAVASVEPVVEEPAADEKPWWEQPAVEEEAPVVAVASVEPVVEEPVADEKPWWEQPAAEEEAPVEAVASVEPVTEMPVADEKPWWEQPAIEDETPVEAVASVEPVVEEPVADEKPWWERPAAEEETPIEAVASVEPVVEGPVTDEKPWWEEPAIEEEAPAEAVASVEPVAEEFVAGGEDDDPWAEFVAGEPEAGPLSPAAASPVASWTPTTPAWTPPTPPPVERDEDMWGEIAAQAEEAAFGADDSPGLDLAASLESQMAEGTDDTFHDWSARSELRPRSAYDDDGPGAFKPLEGDEDVILRAFERHAAMPDPEAQPDPAVERETEEALAALFGQDAAQIVDESGEPIEPRSFLRLSGFAPQRESFDGNWAPEQEVQEVLARDRAPYGGTDGAGFLPPPWAAEEFNGEGEGAPVRHGSKTKTWIRELVETGLLALLVFLSVRASFQNFKVDGNSMYPTLEDGQFLIVNKLVYSEVDVEKLGKFIPFVDAGEDPKRNVFHGPQRGDIVVLQDPRKPETDLIKRVIGLPGETVEIVGGKVYINDLLLEEPYITTPWNDTKPKILIPDGEYYVLGDNRDNSLDSRSSQVGLVPSDLIIGKAMLSYWPRDKFGLAPNEGGALGDQKPTLTTKRIGED